MKENQSNRLMINMSTYLLLQIINLLVGLVLPRLYLAVYGSEINGVVSTVNSFITYFHYLEAGIGLTLVHSLYKPLSEKDVNGTNKILSFSKNQYKKISFIYAVLVIAFSVVFPFISASNELRKLEFITLILVIGAYGTVDFYTMAKYRVLLTADRKEYVISAAMIVAQILRFVLVWFVLQFKLSITIVKLVPIFTLFVRSIILRWYVKKKYSQVSFCVPYEKNIVCASKRWDALLLQISINSSLALPVIIVSQVLNYRQANVYAIYNLVIGSVISLVSALSSGVAPMLGRAIATNKNVKESYNSYEWIVSVVLTTVFSVACVVILPFVRLYVSVVDDINYIHKSYAILFSVWAAIYVYRMPSTALVNAAGMYKENRVNNIINLSIQLVFGVILAILFGIEGVLITMIFAAVQRNIGFSVVIEKKLLKRSLFNSLKRQFLMIAIIILSSSIGLEFVYNNCITALQWIIYSTITVLIIGCIVVLMFIITDYSTFKDVFVSFRSKFFRKKSKTISGGID